MRMLSVRFGVLLVVVCCYVLAEAKVEDPLLDKDYIDDIKEFVAHNAEEAGAKYSAPINQMDMIDDYPFDEDFYDNLDDEEEEEEDYDDEDYDDDEEDDGAGGGCGGGGDDDDEELNPVQEVIEEYFTR